MEILSAPTISNKRFSQDAIRPLDADISDFVTFKIGDIEFEMDRTFAEQSQTLMTMMNNDKFEKTFLLNELKPELFQMVMQ